MRFGLIVLLAACSSSYSEPPQAIDHQPPAAAGDVSPPTTRLVTSAPPAKLTLQWSNVVGVDGCFYFSGPEGRDDRLQGDVTVERDGDHVKLHIGSVIFTGTFRDNELAVTRHSVHDYSGPWDVVETIRGRYREGVMRAKYRYEECELGGSCPGSCTIDANLVFLR